MLALLLAVALVTVGADICWKRSDEGDFVGGLTVSSAAGLLHLVGSNGTANGIDGASGVVLWSEKISGALKENWATLQVAPQADVLVACAFPDTCKAMVASTGSVLWAKPNVGVNFTTSTSPAAVAALDDTMVVVGGETRTKAFDLKTGEMRWSVDIKQKPCVGSTTCGWWASAIAVDSGKIFLCTQGGPYGSVTGWGNVGDIIALDAATGATLWQQPGTAHKMAVSSGIVVAALEVVAGHDPNDHTSHFQMAGFDATSGKKVWTGERLDNYYSWGNPQVLPCGLVFWSDALTSAHFAIHPATGKVAWRTSDIADATTVEASATGGDAAAPVYSLDNHNNVVTSHQCATGKLLSRYPLDKIYPVSPQRMWREVVSFSPALMGSDGAKACTPRMAAFNYERTGGRSGYTTTAGVAAFAAALHTSPAVV